MFVIAKIIDVIFIFIIGQDSVESALQNIRYKAGLTYTHRAFKTLIGQDDDPPKEPAGKCRTI